MCENPEECRYFEALQHACREKSENDKKTAQEREKLEGEIETMKDFTNRLYKLGRKMRQAQMELASLLMNREVTGRSALPRRQETIVRTEEAAFDDLLNEIWEESQKRKAKKEAAE